VRPPLSGDPRSRPSALVYVRMNSLQKREGTGHPMTAATPQVETGFLLLADISGYTSFLESVAAAHPEMTRPGAEVPPAYPIMSSLLDVVVERIAPAFQLAEIEGDAVFGYALGDRLAGDAATLLEIVRSTHGAFRERIEEGMVLQRHDCQACIILTSLELKFVVHHGPFVVHRIAGREKLQSPAVNVAHRLLKNSITQQTGCRAYLLVTDAAADQLRLMPEVGAAHEERYADVGLVTGIVIGLDAAVSGEGVGPVPTTG